MYEAFRMVGEIRQLLVVLEKHELRKHYPEIYGAIEWDIAKVKETLMRTIRAIEDGEI